MTAIALPFDINRQEVYNFISIHLDNAHKSESDKIEDRLSRASELLEIIDDNERESFLFDLATKVCSNSPNVKIIQNYQTLFNWLIEILNTDKYALLKRWNFKKYLINVWTQNIVSMIAKESVKIIDIKMLNDFKQFSTMIKQTYEEDCYIVKGFDEFCKYSLNNIFDKFTIIGITDTIQNGILTCFVDLIQAIKRVDEIVPIFLISESMINTLLNFYEMQFNKTLLSLVQYIKSNNNKINDVDFVIVLKKTLNYVGDIIVSIRTKYPLFASKVIKLDMCQKEIYGVIYNKYIELFTKSINIISNRFTSSFIGKFTKIIKDKTQTPMDIDISPEIIDMCNTIEKFNNVDASIVQYMIVELITLYKGIINIDNLITYDNNIIHQLFYDIIHIKSKFPHYNTMFNEVENQIKFLDGNVHNIKTFIEQFKMFYKNHHTQDVLKKILKFKKVDDKTLQQTIKMYNDVTSIK